MLNRIFEILKENDDHCMFYNVYHVWHPNYLGFELALYAWLCRNYDLLILLVDSEYVGEFHDN